MADAASYPVAGRIGPQLSVRFVDAVRQMLAHLAPLYQRPDPTASVVQGYAEALVEPRRAGKPGRAPRLDALPFATQLLARERQTFPPPAIVVEYVARAERALYEQERATDTNHARQRRSVGAWDTCGTCGAKAELVGPEGSQRYVMAHDAQRHGWGDA
jgi:hypothetical protein